jgi:hypothetical protein
MTSPEAASGAYIAIGSSAGAAVGLAGTAVGSAAGASVAAPPPPSEEDVPHAARTRLVRTNTNNNERTVLVISIFLLIFIHGHLIKRCLMSREEQVNILLNIQLPGISTLGSHKNTRAQEESGPLRGGENVVLFWNDSGAFLCFFLLAQEGEPLLSRIYRNDHKQTKHHQKEENKHAHRIAWSPNSVLYRGFTNTKQLCKCYFSGIEKKIEVP